MKILQQIPTKCTLRRNLKQVIFGNRLHCPHCRCYRVKTLKNEERWRCKKCRKPFSIKSSCWLKGSKLSLETIWLLLWCWQKKIPLLQTQEIVGVSYPTVCTWYQRFREHIPQEKFDTLLSNNIACDEMYTTNNCIIGAKQKGTRNIMLKVLEKKDPTKTDAAEIEGVWGVFRTFVRRMYHHVTQYKLQDLVCEFCLRFRKDEIFDSPLQYLQTCLSVKPFAL